MAAGQSHPGTLAELALATMMEKKFEVEDGWEEPEALTAILDNLRQERPNANIGKIRLAYFVAELSHHGIRRASGEPYITHPLAVAKIVADLHLDDDSIASALLHDVLEDTTLYTREDISQIFGKDVLNLVESVTKLDFKLNADLTDRQKAKAETTRAAESLRKMLLAMAKDFRVMVIKLADRLHNMQTIDHLRPEKRLRIANETLDIYAPLAARLGIWQIKWQLEDLAFKTLHPAEFAKVSDLVARSRKDRENALSSATTKLKEMLQERSIKFVEIQSRPKHLFSIFNKMIKQRIEFEDIYDLLALRIILENKEDCYPALGVVHEMWVPVPGFFSDYINRPKSNGYQSLHTKVIGPGGDVLEIQIRTMEMHRVAEYGVAAHWSYKEGKASLDEQNHLGALRDQLFDWTSDNASSSELLRSLSTDLFSEQVLVFTPKGDVIDLPKGSTPVDFAFRVHSELGLTLVGAKVNGSIVTLNSELNNGDVVELITRSNATPSLDWIEFASSPHTRSKLRNYFRKVNKEADAARGRQLIERELVSLGLDPKKFLTEEALALAYDLLDGLDSPQDVLAKVGTGHVSVQGVVGRLRGTPQPELYNTIRLSRTKEGKMRLALDGSEGVMASRAKCCNPIPGDEVVGYVTRGRGILIHRRVCPNALSYSNHEPERLIAYDWPPDGSMYQVDLKITSLDRQGLLMDVSTIFGESKTNVSAVKVKILPNHTAEINVSIDVTDTVHLAQVMTRISNMKDVISSLRLFGRSASRS